VLGIAGVAGLLVVMVVIISLIAGAGDDSDDEVGASATAVATASPTATPKPKKTPEPLSATEKAERQVAIDLVESKGFTVDHPRDWNPDADLRVLIGTGTTSGMKLAFFFVGGEYKGNDSTEPSKDLKVKKSGDFEATLVYGTPGGPIQIDFRYDGASLAPVQVLPSPTERAEGSP
jgi:hypothetical protein